MIDHQGYPHIIDQILTHASAQLLLSFRATASDYAERCLHLAACHLIVHGTPTSLTIKSARGDLPHFTGDWKHSRLESNPWLHHCHLLDIRRRSGPMASELLGPALKNLKVLRILAGYGPHHSYSLVHYTAPVLVMFGRLPEYDPTTDMFYLWPGSKLPRCRKVVWTVASISSRLPLFLGSNVSPYSHQVESATLHFRCCEPTSDPDAMFAHLGGIVCDIVEYIISKTVTIVDLDSVWTRSPLAAGPIENLEERQIHLLEQLGYLAARVNFMTGPEYSTAYGAEQYRIETCEIL